MAKKTYRVVGDSLVAGHVKGQTFEFEYTPEQEQALIDGGHVQVVPEKKPLKTDAKE